MTTQLLVGSTPEALAAELIRRLASISQESVEERGVFTMAVSGGSMPKVCLDHFELLHTPSSFKVRCLR